MNKHFKQVSRVDEHELSFAWEIENFSSLTEHERYFKSSEIECLDNRWILKLYSNWCPYLNHEDGYYDEKYDFVTLILDDVNDQQKTSVSRVKISLGPKNDPEKFFAIKTKGKVHWSHSWSSNKENPSRYISLAVNRSQLFENCDGTLPDDILIVRCELRVAIIKSSSEEVEKAFQDETKLFAHSGSSELAENIGKVFENGSLSDVTLKVGERQFQVHKIILASRSRVFAGMFASGMQESQENVVEIVDMEPSIAKEMLRYIYTGNLEELTMERALDLYVAADRYDLPELRRWCREFILGNISHHDVCRVAELAELHSDEELAKVARKVFKEGSKMILMSKTWREFAKKNPVLYSNIMEETLLHEN